MQAIILVGGKGTRLRPLTCNIPKAVIPVLNRPFLEHLLRYLGKHGIQDIILAMGYLPTSIRDCLGDGSQLDVHLTYIVEESPLGTAGAVKNMESLLQGAFVVLNGDILTEIDLTDMIGRHRKVMPRVTMALTPVEDPTMYGVVETSEQGLVTCFVEKPGWGQVATNMINAGIYILNPDILAEIPAATPYMFEQDVFPALLRRGDPILAYPSDAYWVDIGTTENYLKAHHDLLAKQHGHEIVVAGGAHIDATARIKGPVLVGAGSWIGENAMIVGPAVLGSYCSIAHDVVIDGALLWDGVTVAEGACLHNCVIGSSVRVEAACDIADGCVLGDYVVIQQGSRLPPDTRIWPDGYVNSDRKS